jgi:hypothetical protein
MGKKAKEHKQKVARRNAMLNNPVTRGAVSLVYRKGVINELSQGDSSHNLQELVGTGTLKRDRLSAAIKSKAPAEMDKAIKNFKKQGKVISVASLTEEARNDKSFMAMCADVGLAIEWFENLAKERMLKFGIVEG